MSMNKILVIILFLLFVNPGYAQPYLSNLKIDIQPSSHDEGTLCMYKLVVEQEFENIKETSFTLKLENIGRFSLLIKQAFFPKIAVYCKQSGSDGKWNTVDFIFDGQNLECNLPDSNKNVKIEYDYYSDYITKVPDKYVNQVSFFNYYNYDWNSWYFTNPDVHLNRATFRVPDSVFFFVDSSGKRVGNEIELMPEDMENLQTGHLSFYMLEKDYYHTEIFQNGRNPVQLFMTKGVIISEDSIHYKPDTLSNQEICFRRNKTKQILNLLSSFFNPSKTIEINIADGYLTSGTDDGQQYIWGQTVKMGKDKDLILMDTSAWKDDINFIHELIHLYTPHHVSKEAPEHYFLEESLVEFLAVCLAYEKPEIKDSVFNKKIAYFKKLNMPATSIFQVSDNQYSYSQEGGGTGSIIYQEVPYLLHQFAKKIGEEKMLVILKDFYSRTPEDGKYLNYFEETMKRNGVSEEEWQSLIKSLLTPGNSLTN